MHFQQLCSDEEHPVPGGCSTQGSGWGKVMLLWKTASAKIISSSFLQAHFFWCYFFLFLLQKAVKLQRKPYCTIFCVHFTFKAESSLTWLLLETVSLGILSLLPAHRNCWLVLQELPLVRGGNHWGVIADADLYLFCLQSPPSVL